MTDTPRRWDRLTAESDPAFEAFAAYLDTGSLRDAYRQRSGNEKATSPPGAWTKWSTTHHWVSRRAGLRRVHRTRVPGRHSGRAGADAPPGPFPTRRQPAVRADRKPHSAHAKAAIAWSAPLSEIRSVTVVLG